MKGSVLINDEVNDEIHMSQENSKNEKSWKEFVVSNEIRLLGKYFMFLCYLVCGGFVKQKCEMWQLYRYLRCLRVPDSVIRIFWYKS